MKKRSGDKKGRVMFNFTGYPEVKVLMKVKRNIPLSSVEAYMQSNTRVQDQIDWEFRKFVGSLAIPLYNKFTNYNFHDTLNSFAKQLFTEQHRKDFEEREKRLEIAAKSFSVETLPFYDKIRKESSEYWKLDIKQQEKVLEAEDRDFQKVIDRLEDKGKDGVMILRLNDVRRLRVKTGQKIKNCLDLDIKGQYVLDSSQLISANRILQFIVERKKRKAMLARLRLER